ncbi:HAMP domain-containing sensor histidine kinase [Streptomyces sp. SPB4]|uniref:HAMP domain-containing sensor histidine kinase n=1 Tax=Streptomyces TaxID=1883 RepID=UPI002474DED8|nr:HAMP domain-containing sensor histidine kinase [Streptomyces sp. SPB4]MDH6542109.1 signal transduction histidine kinase [Streptomyces sp. SPB4]
MRALPARGRRLLRALGLRWKIAVLLAVGCSLVAVTIGALIHQARVRQVADAARKSATEQLVRVRQVYELTGRLDFDKVGEADARIDCPAMPGPLREAALSGRRTTYLDLSGPHPAVWAARPVGGGRVLSVRQALTAEQAELAELDGQLIASGTGVVALSAVGGALLASRLSKDLRSAAETARRISAGDLDARIGASGVPGSRDEVAELSSAVDTMAASLQRRLEAEQRFTADVAHELRTPLTGLHTAAELLPPGRPTELVRDRVGALRTLTEDLLEVARLDANREEARLEEHLLGPLVASITHRSGVPARLSGTEDDGPHGEPGERRTGRPDGAAAGGALVRTDVRRLERILTNLLLNARRHGAGPITVTVSGASVTVRDHGPGFPESLLREGPQRFKTGAAERGQGTGLGLTIAFGQAQVIGAAVTLSNPDPSGAAATVTLPRA